MTSHGTRDWDGDAYQARFDALAAEGTDVHGEATFVRAFSPASVLDAGCGTGRVAIELARHGIDVIGADVDPSMLATARDRDPAGSVTWVEADLCELELGRSVDVVVLAGNVVLFTPPGTQDALLTACAAHVAPGGHLVAGFSTDWEDRPWSLAEHEAACGRAGLDVVARFSTWDRARWSPGSPYAVSVARAQRAPVTDPPSTSR